MNYTDQNEIDCANETTEYAELSDSELEVIAAQYEAECSDHSGCAGCFLLPILLLLIVFTGAVLAF